MRHGKLLREEASLAEIRKQLTQGDVAAVALRIPVALRGAAKEAAAMKGISFSAYMRMCMLDEPASER